MSEKGKNGLIIALILVIIALTCTICYVVIKKNFGGVTPAVENSGEVNNNSNTNENAITKEEVEKIVDKYYGNVKELRDTFTELTSEAKILIAISNLDQSKIFAWNDSMELDFINNCEGNEIETIGLTDVEKVYRDLFNEDMPNVTTINKIASSYIRHEINGKIYYFEQPGCGGPYGNLYNNYVVTNYTENKDTLTADIDLNLDSYENVENTYFEAAYGTKEDVEDAIKEGKLKTKYTYKLTFEKKNGNYILVSSEEV